MPDERWSIPTTMVSPTPSMTRGIAYAQVCNLVFFALGPCRLQLRCFSGHNMMLSCELFALARDQSTPMHVTSILDPDE